MMMIMGLYSCMEKGYHIICETYWELLFTEQLMYGLLSQNMSKHLPMPSVHSTRAWLEQTIKSNRPRKHFIFPKR